ncbi:hypothetical protein ELQ35_00825 [Peribacillus cavernae]|uniref:DUF4440 domain-containing protein n=1 Tax=Peribacillus cavernae TaxID=1674310 RepID=A0A433HX02_9BACI|nr:hypothetical protein ELQ35_00825 [Peribacillus cavernae]
MFVLIIIAIIIFFSVKMFFLLKNEPEDLVKEFYSYEAEGDFGQSWELLHSDMKEKFPNKNAYIQNRSHVFMQHMEVETFKFEIGDSKKRKEWKARKGSTSLKEVYEIPVTQTFDSRFGKFTLQQNCFVTIEKDEWKLLWDYNY